MRFSDNLLSLLATIGLHPQTVLGVLRDLVVFLTPMALDFAEYDRARLARDPCYDGRFFPASGRRGFIAG
jgi:hypothetical protein